MPTAKKKKFYAVANGRVPGVYSTWPDCQAQTRGYGRAVFKSFGTSQEARSFIERHSPGATTAAGSASTTASGVDDERGRTRRKRSDAEITRTTGKRAKREGGRGSRHDERIDPVASAELAVKGGRYDVAVIVYFDGGSRGNPGQAGAGAEVVVARRGTAGDERSSSSPRSYAPATVLTKRHLLREYCGSRATNNFAEYTGMLVGMRHAAGCVRAAGRLIRGGRTSEEEASESESASTGGAGTTGVTSALGTISSASGSVLNSVPRARVQVYGDSELIIKQMNGIYQCKNPTLRPLFEQCREVIGELRGLGATEIAFEHVYREQNKVADELANEAMDQSKSWITSILLGVDQTCNEC